MKRKTDRIGTITLGDKVHVSDPCYETDCWCAGTLDNVLPGRYQCKILRVEEDDCFGPTIKGIFSRVQSLTICHEDYQAKPRELMPIDVGVDSGQAGFYDAEYYPQHHIKNGAGHCDEAWYDRVCRSTLKRVKNPAYMDAATYAKEKLGVPFISDDDLTEAYEKENAGLITEEQLREIRDQWINVRIKYDHDPMCQWETIQVGYAGILDDRCCVASSGYGDGSYNCYVARNADGKIIAARLVFI